MEKSTKKVRIFSALEVANICGVVNQTAINWIKSDHLKAFTTPGGQYRIYAEDLIDFLDKRNMRIPEDLLALGGAPKSLLIVDDDEELNAMLKTFLEKKLKDVSIFQAFDGFEAGQMIFDVSPKIIILDIDLPGIDGIKLCRKIRNNKKLKSPLIISISGLSNKDIEEQILAEGADAFFVKPFDFTEIAAKIAEMLKV